jgi:hypothetical protein
MAAAQQSHIDKNLETIQKICDFNQYLPYIISNSNDDMIKQIYANKKHQFNVRNYNPIKFKTISDMIDRYYFILATPEHQRHGRKFSKDDITIYSLFATLYNIESFSLESKERDDSDWQHLEVALSPEIRFIELLVSHYKTIQIMKENGIDISDIYQSNPNIKKQCIVMKKYLRYKTKYLELKKLVGK